MRGGRGRGARARARRALLRPPARRASSTTRTRALLAELGVNCVRIPVNYRHFERDERPVRAARGGLRAPRPRRRACAPSTASTASSTCTRCPAARTSTGTPTTRRTSPPSGSTRTSRTASCTCGRRSPTRYRDEPVGRGLQPAQRARRPERRGRRARSTTGSWPPIREIDPDHIVFVDGNTYSTDFSMFAEPYENAVYACHDYARAGMAFGGPVSRARPRGSGSTATSSRRSSSSARATSARPARRSGSASSAPSTPATPSATSSATRSSPTSSTSTTRHGAGWSIWTYKDVGLQGLVHAAPDSPYMQRFGAADREEGAPGHRLVGLDRPGGPRGRRADPRADRARVPGLVALPVEPARDDRRPRAPHPLRPGDAARVRRALPRARRRRARRAGGLVRPRARA